MRELSHFHHRKQVPYVQFVAENADKCTNDTKQIFGEFVQKRHLKSEETITLADFSEIQFCSSNVPTIVRDLLFYLTGYVFGIQGQSAANCVEFYKALLAQNRYAIKQY